MEIAEGASGTLSHDLITRLARYRHQVFVERLGWPLPPSGGLELHQFDRPDALPVIG